MVFEEQAIGCVGSGFNEEVDVVCRSDLWRWVVRGYCVVCRRGAYAVFRAGIPEFI